MNRLWCKAIEAEINGLKERVKNLEGDSGCQRRSRDPETIELNIEWPEANIGGLHFNMQKTHGVFELKDDGNYYSCDILFHSARDTDEGTGRDLLSEYLDSEAVKRAFCSALYRHFVQVNSMRVFLPEGNPGIKKYNGVSWWYWLRPRSSGSAAGFCYVSYYGTAGSNGASAVGGCAPAFRVA
jgi:hypothetical protein